MSDKNETSSQKPWLDPNDSVRKELVGHFQAALERERKHKFRLDIGQAAIKPIPNLAHPMYDSELYRGIQRAQRTQAAQEMLDRYGEPTAVEQIIDDSGELVGENRTYNMPLEISTTATVNIRGKAKH